MKKRSLLKAICLALTFLLVVCCFFFSCEKKKTVMISEMTLEELSDSIEVGEYKNLELQLEGKSKEAVLLYHLSATSRVKKYPEGTVDYYLSQLKKQYEYYAKQADIRYEALLDELGEDNFTMLAEARRLVKQDMIFELIRRTEDITLSESDKNAHFDRYVSIYSEKYGYEESYVREELSELVYESMLYDKTLEYLIINNAFIQAAEDGSESESGAEETES